MNPRPSDTRQRVVAAAADMLARHGLNATSIREMAKRADAPLGSTYHHFPGGKHQMISEAVRYAGTRAGSLLEQYLQAGSAPGLHAFLAMWREILVRSRFRMGCPVMAAAVEEPIDEVALEALKSAAHVFDDWEEKLSSALQADGHDHASAAELATLIVAGIEGAIGLCRARRNIAPFDRVSKQLQMMIERTKA